MKKLSHVDSSGRADMVDVSQKPLQFRVAKASGFISIDRQTLDLISVNQMKKGDVLCVARIAGIQAAKETSHLIPLCHTLLISKAEVECTITDTGVAVWAIVKSTGQTGVEMEALTAVSVALLTVYDMCKAADKNMIISDIRLNEKTKTDL